MANSRQHSARGYFDAHHACVVAWMDSGYSDHSALDGVAPALEAWLNDYPAQAEQIQQIALTDAYTASAWQLHHVVEATARVGLDAAFIRPEVTRADRLAFSVLGLLLAEALLEQDKVAECQRMFDFCGAKIASLEEAGPVCAYLDLHFGSLAGVFAEAMLEYGIASDHYRQATKSGLPLLDDPAQMQELARAWTPLLYGAGPDLIPDGAAQSAAILEYDIRSACHRAVLGYANTAQTSKAEAAQQAIRFVCRHGLPLGDNPVDLRTALLALPFADLHEHLPDLLTLADDFQRQWGSTAWKVLVHTTTAVHPDAPATSARLSLNEVAHLVSGCNDALTLAVATGDLMTAELLRQHPVAGSKAYDDTVGTIRHFLALAGAAGERLAGSTKHLPFKALLDEPIGRAVEWLFDYQQGQPLAQGPLLSVLLDALRTREQQVPPLEFEIGSEQQALVNALNRLGRLGFAMTQAKESAVIVMQTVGENTLFICATGDRAEPLVFDRAGPTYQAAARQLTNALRAVFNLPATDDPSNEVRGLRPRAPSPASPPLEEAGKAAYSALPERVRGLVARHRALIWVPDFRSDQDGVPFELFHDGTNALGLSKVMARALSLQDLLWAIEPPVLPPHDPRRALVVAAPHVPGFVDLIHSEKEAQEIRSMLATAGLESPALEESELDPPTLLHGFEKASVVHIAAHGITFGGGEALVLPAGERLLASDIERKPQFLRSFTFLNTCSLGQSRYLGGGVSRGIAYALLRQHAPAVIANLLPVYDRSSARLSVEFYKEAHSASVGEALRRSRATLAGEGVSPAHWGCTVLIGDPGHELPSTKASAPAAKRKRDTAARLLDTYTNPKNDEQESEAAFSAAMSDLARGGHPRLLAGMGWIEGAAAVDPDQPADPDAIERLAALAHEIGHTPGEALMRFHLAIRPPEGRGSEERLADLDAAIRALEPLDGYDQLWSNLVRECLSARQRLMVPQEPPVMNLGGMRVNDQTIPEIRAFFDVQRALDQQQIRRSREARLRLLETTLEDVAWNAVVIGQENRFTADEAHLEFAALLAEKLCLKKLLNPLCRDHARRIMAGFLPYLWGSQRIIHLDRDLAIGQAGTLALVLRSIAVNWVPPEVSTAYPMVAELPSRIDRAVELRESVGISKYASALLAITSNAASQDELSAMGSSLRDIIEEMVERGDPAAADCAAWIVGLLLEKRHTLASGSDCQVDAAAELQRISDDLESDLEAWFMPYLMDGFASVRSAGVSILDLWH